MLCTCQQLYPEQTRTSTLRADTNLLDLPSAAATALLQAAVSMEL